jgi:polyhydroxyalkanoate synthase
MLGGDLLQRIREDVDRHAMRARNGIRYAAGGEFVRVGATAHSTLWARDAVALWRYDANAGKGAPAVVLVPSLINRSYIFDLHPGNSFVERLLEAGLDVFAVDWGEATPADAANTLETYVDGYLPEAVAAAVDAAAPDEVTLMGYCLGGILGLLYTAGHDAAGVRDLVCLATPVDFDEMGLLVAMVREGRLEVDAVLDEDGHVPGDVVRRLVELRRPTGSLVTYANLWENLWNDRYMAGYQAMARWVRETVPVPGAFARQVTDLLIRRNALMTGHVALGGREIALADVGVPVLSVVAEHDDMVPLAAASPLPGLIGRPDAEELRLPSGHISLVVGHRAATVTTPHITDWIRGHVPATKG